MRTSSTARVAIAAGGKRTTDLVGFLHRFATHSSKPLLNSLLFRGLREVFFPVASTVIESAQKKKFFFPMEKECVRVRTSARTPALFLLSPRVYFRPVLKIESVCTLFSSAF